MAAFNLCIRLALDKPGTTHIYMLPTISQARSVIWAATLGSTGKKFLDFIPPEWVAKISQQNMEITLKNTSVIKITGSDNYNRLVGSEAYSLIFSEASLMDPQAWDYLQPIIRMNGGIALFIGTPRGCNFFKDWWDNGLKHPDIWFTQMLTVDDTKLLSREEIDGAIARSEISKEKSAQEYDCSFLSLNEQTYYGSYMDDARLHNRIGDYPYNPNLPVHTFWDFGHRDQTICLFAQLDQGKVIIIDSYGNTGQGLEHYTLMMQSKRYTYGSHVGPHDLRVHELSTGNTRWAKLHSLGYPFKICIQTSVENGIEAVRSMLNRTYFNESTTRDLVKALDNYRSERVSIEGATISKPKHDAYSDWADALRYCALMVPTIKQDGITPEQLRTLRQSALYGNNSNPFFT